MLVWTIRVCSNFTVLASGTNIFFFLRNVWRDFRLPMSAVATVARKSFNGKFTVKMNFQLGMLFYHCWCWHWKSKSLHLISIWTTCWWNLNKIVWSELYKILSFKNGHFWQVLRPFLEDVSVNETIVWWYINLRTIIFQNFGQKLGQCLWPKKLTYNFPVMLICIFTSLMNMQKLINYANM